MLPLSYEAYLDEVTTLITEKYDVSDDIAIKIVMRAQENEFFCVHDENAELRNLDQAHKDARAVFKKYQ